jgi:hypothetical protein
MNNHIQSLLTKSTFFSLSIALSCQATEANAWATRPKTRVERMEEGAYRAKERVKEGVKAAADTVKEGAHLAADKAAETGHAIKSGAHHAGHKIKEGFSKAGHTIKDGYNSATKNIKETFGYERAGKDDLVFLQKTVNEILNTPVSASLYEPVAHDVTRHRDALYAQLRDAFNNATFKGNLLAMLDKVIAVDHKLREMAESIPNDAHKKLHEAIGSTEVNRAIDAFQRLRKVRDLSDIEFILKGFKSQDWVDLLIKEAKGTLEVRVPSSEVAAYANKQQKTFYEEARKGLIEILNKLKGSHKTLVKEASYFIEALDKVSKESLWETRA